ncbi:MAG TPA: hypothetical protein VHU19_06725 [Pyrinomonadaceae bacterium]|jgi:hypothetical protein|nr:hypothetical protein [Pyrinomonadaceae bacterium]
MVYDNPVSLEEFWGVVKRLTGDASRCMMALEETPEEDEQGKAFWRRMYARAVFAVFEGATYRMTYHAYAARGRCDVTFSLDELNRLERSYDFDEDQEEFVATFSRTRMLDNIKFAFNAFARVHYSDYVLSINDPSWVLIEEIVFIKDFLQYPKGPEGTEVFDENVDTLVFGLQWFLERMVELVEDSRDCFLAKAAAWEAGEDRLLM